MSFLQRFLWVFVDLLFPLPFEENELQKIPSSGPNNIHSHVSLSLFDYRDMRVKKMIRYFKNHPGKRLFFLLVPQINDRLDEHFSEISLFTQLGKETLVTPIPMHPDNQKKRGFNQNTLLSKYLAERYDWKYSDSILIKRRKTKKQALLNTKPARFKNIKGCMSIATPTNLIDKNVIIVDDLSTSGATLLEAERVLLKTGAKQIFSITLAH